IVEYLEERYPQYPGLNLTYEVREGIIKHDTIYDKPESNPRFMPGKSASLESQVVDICDEIAYNCADLDDALKLNYIEEEDLREINWLYPLFEKARHDAGMTTREKYVRFRAIGDLYDTHINDALNHSSSKLEESGVSNVDEVREYSGRLVDF